MQTFNVAVTPETYPQLTECGLPNDAGTSASPDPGKVGEYNAKNGTEYELLREAACDLTEEVLVKAGTPKSGEALSTVHAKGNIEAFKEYLLPVSITSVEGAVAIIIAVRPSTSSSEVRWMPATWSCSTAPDGSAKPECRLFSCASPFGFLMELAIRMPLSGY